MVDEPKITLKVRLDSIFQMISNKVTSWSQTPSNDKYPSEKLVKDSLDGKVNKVTGKGLSTNDFDGYYKGMIDGLSTVATTGDYNDLYNIPSDLLTENDVSSVALSGDYNDLDNTPSIPRYTSELNNDGDGGANKYVLDDVISDVAKTGSYNDLTNKPSYTPTITSSTTGAYKIGSINVNGSDVDIYGKDIDTVYTHPTYSDVAKSTSAIYKFKTNSLGHIIEISTVSASDLPSHNHDDRYYTETEIDTALGGKAPTSHASSSTTYGVSTSSNYGHTKVINNLTTLSNNNGEALSAYQGKVLNDNKLARDSVDNVEGTGKNNSLYNCISFYSGDSTGQITKGNGTVILQCVGHNSVFLLDMNKLKSVIDFNDADEYKICDFSSIGSSQFSDDGTTYSSYINGGKIYGSVLNGKLLISIYDNNDNEIFYTDVNSMPPYVYIHMQTNQSVMIMTMSNIDNVVGTVEINAIANIVYPVGSIYMSMSSTSPQTLFGGVWEQLKDRFLLGVGDTYSEDSTGGSATVTLTSAQSGLKAHGHGMAHNHNHRHNLGKNFSTGSGSVSAYTVTSNRSTSTQYTGYDSTASSKSTTDNNTASDASEAHENMPPYLTVYMWKRIV